MQNNARFYFVDSGELINFADKSEHVRLPYNLNINF